MNPHDPEWSIRNRYTKDLKRIRTDSGMHYSYEFCLFVLFKTELDHFVISSPKDHQVAFFLRASSRLNSMPSTMILVLLLGVGKQYQVSRSLKLQNK